MRSILFRNRLYCRLLTALLLSLTCLYSSAQASDHRVTINGTEIPLKAVFKAIKKQTGFAVMYNTSVTMLNQQEKVTVSFKETPLDEVLSFLLKGRNLSWTYNDDVVVIYKKMEETPKKTEIATDSTVSPALLMGKVTDAAGSPLPGVTVQVKGTSQGTTTDADGKFTLPKVGIGDVLVLTSVGFEKREISIKGKSILAQLNLQVSQLDETVAIAYGTTTRRLSTGNIGTIKAKDIERQPINNPLLALQGRIPGLLITQANGIPGGGVTVRIQGQNSINNGNDPLIIIDGVPYFSQNLQSTLNGNQILGSSGDNRGTQGNPLSYINPSDIESIDILKDADATAIYGSRAANGAILITTKKGKAGQPKLDINLQQGWGKVGHFIDLLNTPQYMEMRREARKNDNTPFNPNHHDLSGLWDTTRYTDWQKELIGGTAKYSNFNVGISGGTNNIQYLVAGTYHRETTVFPGNFRCKNGAIHFNINSVSSNEKFRFQFSGSYLASNNNLPYTDFTRSIFLAPVAPPLYNSDGTLNWAPDPNANGNSSWTNPLANLNTIYENKTTSLVSNAILSYRILPGLDVKTSFGYTNQLSNEFAASLITSEKPENRPNFQRLAQFSFNTTKSWIIEPQINYKRDFGKSRLDLLIGGSIQQQDKDGKAIYAAGQPDDQLLRDLTSATVIVSYNKDLSTYKYNAGFARLNYNWQEKYILNLTGRRDGSSRFGDKNKFHNFGSIGAAWIFSQETFVQKALPFLSFGKLKGSYGSTGSDQIGDYLYLSLYSAYVTGSPYQGMPSLSPVGLPNPYLQWEETRKLQAGIDLGFLNDRILLTATYVRNRSTNQLLNYILPNTTGFTGVTGNFPALVQNAAWEFELNTINISSKHFKWTSSFNLTIPRNKLLAFPDLETSSYYDRLIVGQPITVARNFHYFNVDPLTGVYQVYNQKGEPTTTPDFTTDATVLYTTTPRLYGGFQNSFEYKGFQLDLFLQFTRQKNFNFYSTSFPPGAYGGGAGNQPVTVLARWQKPGDITNVQRYNADYSLSGIEGDRTFQGLSYIRLKNISLSYQLKERFAKKAGFSNCRIYIHAQNVWTLTRYKGLDPENLDATTLPPLRVVTLGIQASL